MSLKIKLFTEEDIINIVSKFACTYNSSACQWENSEDVEKDILSKETPMELIGGKEFIKVDEVYIEDSDIQEGRYKTIYVPIEIFKPL